MTPFVVFRDSDARASAEAAVRNETAAATLEWAGDRPGARMALYRAALFWAAATAPYNVEVRTR
jgi:hypothetical protein